MHDHYYFAYGSNTNLEQMKSRCPQAINLGWSVLENYRLAFRGHADVELSPGDQVEGLLWSVDDYDLEGLDIYEGFPDYYLRHRAMVYSPELGFIKSWIYEMGSQDWESKPSQGYYDGCLAGYDANNISARQLIEAASRAPVYAEPKAVTNTRRRTRGYSSAYVYGAAVNASEKEYLINYAD